VSWETQGRQYHQWFGHGTASDAATSEDARPEKFAGDYTDEKDARRALGMDRAEFNKNLHSLKKRLLRGNDNVIIHVPSGDVFFNGEHIRNVFDG
jgi:hypothetical protein